MAGKGGRKMFPLVEKYSYGVSRRCDVCDRTWKIDYSSCDSLYVITFSNGVTVNLCGNCALRLADDLCDVLDKTRMGTTGDGCL